MFEFPIVFAHQANADCHLCSVEPVLDPFDELARLINGGEVERSKAPVRPVEPMTPEVAEDFLEVPTLASTAPANAFSAELEDELRRGFEALEISEPAPGVETVRVSHSPVALPDLPEAMVPETEVAQIAEPLRVEPTVADLDDAIAGDLDVALSDEFEAALQADLEAAAAIETHVAQQAAVNDYVAGQTQDHVSGDLAAVAPYAVATPAARNWRMPIAAAAVLALGAGSAAAWVLAGSDEPTAAPLLVADAGAAKVKPVEVGGQIALNSGSAVFAGEQADSRQEKLQGEAAEPVRTASIAPKRRAPLAVDARKVKTVVVKPDGTIIRVDGPARVVGQVEPAAPKVAAVEVPQPTVKAPSIDEQVASIKSAPVAVTQPVAVREPVKAVANPIQPVVTKKAEPAAEPATPASAPNTPKAAVVKELPKGTYVVQMASQRSQDAAEKSWSNLKRRYASIIGSRDVDYQRKELAGKGTYYRVRLVASSKSDARAVCADLKRAGGSCFVTR